MKVYLMIAEHFSVAGIVVKVCATRKTALHEAMACVNVMLADDGGFKTFIDETDIRVTDEATLETAIAYLQDVHGAAHCYAEISEHEVI